VNYCRVINADALDALREMEDESVDALVTDPPAGISFMQKAWDTHKSRRHFIDELRPIFEECLRVLKPGAHGVVWALPRTSHWTATALEDAGFEIRDVGTHLFGSGFPKSQNVSKMIDASVGAEREIIGKRGGRYATPMYDMKGGKLIGGRNGGYDGSNITAPATESAKQWDGWGTALKPAAEFWILVRKPLSEKTIAANVLKHGTGAINIDGCRIGTEQTTTLRAGHSGDNGKFTRLNPPGRWPPNVAFSHHPLCADDGCIPGCVVRQIDEQSGTLTSGKPGSAVRNAKGIVFQGGGKGVALSGFGDSGGASRFMYCAKPSVSETQDALRNISLFDTNVETRPQKNSHPTKKPVNLMRWLIRLVTPPGGIILDLFAGSGTTGVAALAEGFDCILIEREAEYAATALARVQRAQSGAA
jgi:hypothetical protein